jgi:hypothetical protein
VNFAPIVEKLNASPVATRTVFLTQVSEQSPQTFSESLVAASKASSSTSTANQAGTGTGNRQKPVSQDETLPRSTPRAHTHQLPATPQKTVQHKVVVAHQLPSIDPASISMQQPVVAKSDSALSTQARKENDSPPATSVFAQVPLILQTAENPSKALGNRALSTVSSSLSTSTNTDARVSAGAVPGVLTDATQGAASSAAPSAVAGVVPTALLSAVPITNLSADSIPVTIPARTAVSSAIDKTLPDAIPGTVPTALPGALPSAIQTLASPNLLNEIPDASSKAAPALVVHDAMSPSARGADAPKSSSASTSQADPPAVAPDPGGLSTGLSTPGATSDQLVALIEPGGGLLVTAQGTAPAVSSATAAKPSVAIANGKDGANNAINDATGLKQHAQATSDASQTGSQGTGQSGDQSQDDASQQGQSIVPAQVIIANHTAAAVDHAQSAAVAAPSPAAPTAAGVTGHTTRTADIAAQATIALPQSVPVINTAKLIQSMGQSEMHVGMRSNDFGNISISTSATRDLISAQISLDHAELARTLAVHLPEMQARLGGDQAMNVRIDMNGLATGQGAETSSGMSNGSPDGSRGDRQQKSSTTSSQSADGFAGQGSSIAVAGLPPGEGRLNLRIDIRV